MNDSSAPSLRPAKQSGMYKFWLWLITPAAATEAALRYRTCFLGALLVLLAVFFLAVDVIHRTVMPTYTVPWYRYLFLGIAYVLNRKGHYGVASTLGIASFPVVIFVSTLLGLNQNTLFHLYYAILGLMVGSMLLPIRGVLVFGLVQIGIMALFPVLAPELFPDFGIIFPPLLLNLIFLPLICLSMYQRSQLEKVRQAELNTLTEQLQQTLDAAYLGTTDWDIVTNVVSWSPHAERIFGLAEGTFEGTYESYLRLVYPEDLPSVQKAIEATLQSKDGRYMLEHRILWPNGQLHWIEGRGRVLYDDTGQPVRTMGTVMDITQQKQAEEALHNYNKRLQLLHLIDKGLLASESPQTIAQIVAENVQRLIGCERVSVPLFDFQTQQVTFLAESSTIPTVGSKEAPISMEQYGLHILEANQRGEVYSTPDVFEDELRMRTKHQDAVDHIRAWIGVPMFYNGELIGSLNLGSLQPHFFTETQKEIAEEVANQLAIALYQSRLSKETSEALRREQRLNVVAHTISNTLDLSALLPKIVQLSIDLMDADAGSMGLITPDEQALAHPYLLNLPEGIGLDALIPKGQGVAWRIISTKKGFMTNNYPADPDALPQWVRAGLRSYIEVPLIAGDSCLGVLGVFQLSQEKKFKPRDLALAESIGQQAGIAIQNARLFAATQRQLQELSVLRVMAEAGASATNEDALLEQIAKIVSQTLYPDIFGIGLWDETIQALRPHPASRGIPESLLGSTFRLGEGVVGWVAASHRPWRIPDTRREAKYLPLIPDILSEMTVPILAGDRLIGILDVESKKQNAFSEADERLLLTLAGQLALALERLRVEASLRAIEVQRRELLERVILLGKTITQITDLDKCLRQIHQSIQTGLGFDRVGLYLYDAQKSELQGTYGTSRTGEMEPIQNFIRIVDRYEPWQLVIQSPRGFTLVDDYQQIYAPPETDEMYGVRQHLSLAAWAGEKPVALIAVDNLITGRPISSYDIEILQLFAGYVGLAIENARWNAELEHRVNERTAQLEFANQELESFSYSVSHDLRAPLRAIDGFSTMLTTSYAAQLTPDSLRYLHLIQDNVHRMAQLINDLLAFSRLSRQPLRKQWTDPTQLVHQVIEDLSADLAARQVQFEVANLPACQADPSLLRQVFVNLIGNAIKYTRPREIAKIHIHWKRVNGETIYLIQDNGVGFSMEYAGKLFGVFQRLHSSEMFEGTGIGLAIVQRIIVRHGGRVWAEAEVEKGATFNFTLE